VRGRKPDAERLRTFLKRDFLKPHANQVATALTMFEPFFPIANGDVPISLVKKDDELSELIHRNSDLLDGAPDHRWNIHILDTREPSPIDFLPYTTPRCVTGEARTSLFLEGSLAVNECLLLSLKQQFQEKIRRHYPRMGWQFLNELESRLGAPFYELMDAVIRGDKDLTQHVGRIQLFLVGIYPMPSRTADRLYLPVAQN